MQERVAAAKARAGGLLANSGLGKELQGLNQVLAEFLEGKAAEIGGLDENAVKASLNMLLKGASLDELTEKSLQAQFRRFTEPLSFCTLEISSVLYSVERGIAGLNTLELKPFHKITLTGLLSNYRGPGFFALVALPTEATWPAAPTPAASWP